MAGSDWSGRVAFDRQTFGRLVLVSICALFGMAASAQLLPEDVLDDDDVVEEVRYYSVEVIVFEYASNVSVGNEIFEPAETEEAEPRSGVESQSGIPVYGDVAAVSGAANNNGGVIEFGDVAEPVEDVTELELIPSLSDIDFKLLAPEDLTMGDIHERLVTLDAYQPVLWGGWVQSTHEEEATPSIRLRALGVPPIHIDGTLTLYLKNYLHLAVDLTREQQIATVQPIYRQEKPSRGDLRSYDDSIQSHSGDAYELADGQTIVYQIQEDRLFNSGQLRYYDHPKFGVLALVNRVEVATPEGEEGLDEDESEGPSMLSRTE